LIGGPVENL